MSIQEQVNRSRSPTATSIDLRRLLDRLQHTLLSPGADRYLRKSSYQRTKVGANLDYARTLLLRLERDTPTAPASRTTVSKVQLDENRALLKQLQARLAELNEVTSDAENGELSAESDAEDLVNRYAPAVNNVSSGIDLEDTSASIIPSEQRSTATTDTTSTLRARGTAQTTAQLDTATTSSSSFSDSKQKSSTHPFAPSSTSTSPFAPAIKPDTSASTTDALMNHHLDEQNALTDSLLSLAGALKQATLSFADSVTNSESLVDRTASALDKTVGGMEAAGSRMGMLRKMTEGRGWWARLSLYAYVGIGWFVALVVVFILPKLRF